MRGADRRLREARTVSLRAFDWERPLLATLRHSTLPRNEEIAGSPLAEAGTRDRLSLVAQFAAHQALLQFAGIADGDFDAEEWCVVRRRGADCRLVRIGARAPDVAGAPPPLTLIQQFAEHVTAPTLEVLKQPWGRADSVYLEAYARLRGDIAADVRWTRRAAYGELAAPGPDALRTLAAERYASADPSCLESLETLAALDATRRLIVLRGVGLFERYGAFREVDKRLSESEAAERLMPRFEKAIVVLADEEAFDASSRKLVQILSSLPGATWIGSTGTPLPDAAHFLVAPSLPMRRALEERLRAIPVHQRRGKLERFVESPAFDGWLERGELPWDDLPPAVAQLAEPKRSYLAALALLGRSIPRELASRYLRELMCDASLEELAVDGVSALENGSFLFLEDAVREQTASLIPAASRASLCKVAASVAEENGDFPRAARLLSGAGEKLTPHLARNLADTLLEAGRYRDAKNLAPRLDEADRELVLAAAERRMGDYTPALARLERLPRSLETDLLRAEILLVERRADEAHALLASTQGDDVRLSYARAVVALDRGETPDESWLGDDYYSARYLTYRDGDLQHVEASLQRARTPAQRIDALLDRMNTLFTAGRWPEARAAAIEALVEVEETQGDRAAGGFLFVLAYLCADDGQWAHAAHRIERLHQFYGSTRDGRRLAELDLLAAHLDFSRGRFDAARNAAAALVAGRHDPQIHAAACLILDELDWIEGKPHPLRIEHSQNVELDRRARINAMRRAGLDTPPSTPTTGAEKLQLFRFALGHHQHALAAQLANELGIELRPPAPKAPDDLRILRLAALGHDLGVPHRYLTRNRLGQWHGAELPNEELDRILSMGQTDWIACSDRELLYLEGLSSWPPESRDAIAATFRTRSELQRLRRVMEQEESAAPRAQTVDGIVGDSPAMKEVFALIAKVARRDVPVCILGESGTGKELVARAIFAGSSRRHKPFIAVNCAALPENLIESELFGHLRGAFTGADRDRAGLIETADGGTLFLDEIGELPPGAQAKLLRFLQEGEFRRVGDTANRTADVRIVSATNRKLESAVEDGRFREDLYYRIRGVELALPPLRERAEDIRLLAAHFVSKEREKHRTGPARLSPDVEAIFRAYAWPGNVRELQNTIRAAHAMAGEAKELEVEHLPERLRQIVAPRASSSSYQDAVARFRRDLIEKSLDQAMGNQNQAAAMLNISRQALAYQIRELGILVNKRPKM
ncbi:MAG TPA: sigma 54-interacting transcriptional regulator [Thermoanaerobaculia bacterium]|nr:sigma 54-interacting transcriptional regulator [Thermoanaerobaculia bacterium]